MKLIILSAALSLIISSSFAQNGWVKTRVGKELSVSFPQSPTLDIKPEKGLTLYAIKGNGSNCLFSVLVRENAVSNYDSINKLSLSKREIIINDILNQGIINFIGNSRIESPTMHFRINNYYGKEMTYSQYDNTKKRWVKNYTKFILADKNAYIIQCSVYKEGACTDDKNTFLNSINTN